MWDPRGNSELLYRKQSPWQDIRLYKNGEHYWMSLNGVLQFHTAECYDSHSYMCDIPIMAAAKPKKALVIGGGDGFAARQLAQCPYIEDITNVEIDGDLVNMTKHHPVMRVLTDNAFNNPKVKVKVGDGIGYLLDTPEKYDIIVDDCEYEYTDQENDRESEAEEDRYEAYLRSLVTKLNPGGVSCIMEPLVRVKKPRIKNLANRLIGQNRFFYDRNGRILDHTRYTQERLRDKLSKNNMTNHEEISFFKEITPYVKYKIFMSQVIGPEAYIYLSNQPIRTRRLA